MHLPIELVLNVITCSLPKPNVLLRPEHPITQLLLQFTLVCHETRRVANRALREHCVYLSSGARLRSLLLAISVRPDLKHITALFLAPFSTTIDQPTTVCIRELLFYTCRTLKRLIIDMPLRSLNVEDVHHLVILQTLQQGLSRLEHLEEFVSVRDEIIFDPWSGEVPLTHWPKLKRLANYNPTANRGFWRSMAGRMKHLETLVLTRADGLRDCDIKAQYFSCCNRPIKVLLINVDSQQMRYGNFRRGGWAADKNKIMTIMTYSIPLFMDDDAEEVCQDYVKIGAEHGTLRDWEGELIPHPPLISEPPSPSTTTNSFFETVS
ncbi:hypothetical protein BU23DRAFT_484864 [Bimuria novae-zelandiae CBS 107.79]|uniref:F-box domain-containing protein n=1 Tax=Bimuria novae-zelandiae CBS 107.79 TaxID=1447943 RepID=A0A6A5UQU9_9PLEO|nr:hypothetical protein BU23DRAFT_484864 [Bimuria novae-zelandiae CBS 107.79]